MFQINKFSRKFMSTAIAKDGCFIQTTVSCTTSYHAAGNKIVTILHMKKYDMANVQLLIMLPATKSLQFYT